MSSLSAVMIQLHLPNVSKRTVSQTSVYLWSKVCIPLYLSSTFISAVYCTYCSNRFCGVYDLAIACYNYKIYS